MKMMFRKITVGAIFSGVLMVAFSGCNPISGDTNECYRLKTYTDSNTKLTYTYNEAGRLTEADGTEYNHPIHLRYDDDELLVEYNKTYSDGLRYRNEIYAYDDDKHLLSITTTRNEPYENSKTIYTYNDNGLLSAIDVDPENNGTLQHLKAYEYDENGHRTREFIYTDYGEGHDGEIEWQINYTYDDQGRLRQTKRFDPRCSDCNSTITRYTYDSQGNLSETNESIGDGYWSKKYTYDADNRLIKIEYNSRYIEEESIVSNTSTTTFKYNSHGYRTQKIFKSGYDTITTSYRWTKIDEDSYWCNKPDFSKEELDLAHLLKLD
jgi:YD repeat-containing protein